MTFDTGEPADIVVVDVKEVARGYRLSHVIGSEVVNDRSKSIGTLDDLIIGSTDRILFAVLQVGGFLGIGGRLVAIEFQSLNLDRAAGTLRIVLPGATREALKNLPEFVY